MFFDKKFPATLSNNAVASCSVKFTFVDRNSLCYLELKVKILLWFYVF